MRIPVIHLIAWYLTHDFSHNPLIPKLPTIFFGVLHPRNVHNLMGWVQEYEKKSNEELRFPYSCTLSMYSKNENFLTPPPSFLSFISSNKQSSTTRATDTTPPPSFVSFISSNTQRNTTTATDGSRR